MSSKSPQPNDLPAQDEEALEEVPAFGWTPYAEKINGRFAMVGIIALLMIEVLTHQDFLTWLNLR